jgi:uncharacterized protein
MHIIDRRLNPSGKNLENRQRFLRRAKRVVEHAVREASRDRAIDDLDRPCEITISTEDMRQPTFRHTPGAHRDYVLPGNRDYVEGDQIEREMTRGGRGSGFGSGRGGGNAEDAFKFILTREEFLNIFLDDLELPELAKRRVALDELDELRRAGYTTTGAPANLSLSRTLRTSLSRRIALRRPTQGMVERLEQELGEAMAAGNSAARSLAEELEALNRRRGRIAFLDPLDLRYRRFERTPKPVTQAVMFCLMDVSGSMTEHMKDIAKRFFMLLHIFLTRRYKRIELVFIRHTDRAAEVDQETFFHSTETGGTLVSSALSEMVRIVEDRYDPSVWNIYAAQASDGDNQDGDNGRARELLQNAVLPLCQYFAYLEVSGSSDGAGDLDASPSRSSLWITYAALQKQGGKFQMRRVSRRSRIFSVFRELFQRRSASQEATH